MYNAPVLVIVLVTFYIHQELEERKALYNVRHSPLLLLLTLAYMHGLKYILNLLYT